MAYAYSDLLDAYRAAGVAPGRVVYATTDLMAVADYEERGSGPLMAAHYRALRESLGDTGTLVVPARSMQICNTDTPFDPATTPSNIGAFPEYVRRQPDVRRSFHPFTSYAAVGAGAAAMTADVSRHAYGPETPEARLIEADALCVCIGVKPNISCSTIHHVEQVMAVPYRYTKEFVHPVVRDGETVREPFYMYVWYRGIGVTSDRNEKLFARLAGRLPIAEVAIGRGMLRSYSIRRFYELSSRAMADDIYVWCARPPAERPYTR